MKGGKREGAGRKKGVGNKSTQEIKAILDARVDFGHVVDKLLELVDGVEVQDTKGGNIIFYSKPPDAQAARILLEYRFGKPSQAIDVTSDGEALPIKTINVSYVSSKHKNK